MAGQLSEVVLAYEAALRAIVASVVQSDPADVDWSPLAGYVAVDEFERVGTWMEVSDWTQYTAFLTRWASASAGFETVIRRVCEVPNLVYLEVEEHHARPGGRTDVVNSLSVYEFTDEGKIRHLDVYLQQPR